MEKRITSLPREILSLSGRFLDNGKAIDVPWKKIYERFGVDSVIRIHKKDFPLVPRLGRYAHFNLEVSHHQPGAVYLIVCITQPGRYVNRTEEILPVLDLSTPFKAKCLSVKELVPYSEIRESDFEYSLPNIQYVNDLKREILWRYHQSLPAASKKEILERGVSITTLDIL